MTTLYELLGALPGDDADDLRDAFRRAVKDVHPDIRPNDPEAALKFRLLVYAMEVLRDPEQRAAYDHLMELAQQELLSQQRAAKLRNFSFAMIALAGATIVAVGMSILFAPTSALLAPASETRPARPGLNENSTAANGEMETARPVEMPGDFLTRWGANDIVAKVDRDAATARPLEEQNDHPLGSDASSTSAPADRDTEITAPAKARDDPSPPAVADDNAAAIRDVEAATVMKELESPLVPPPVPSLPVQPDETAGTKAPAPDDDTDASAAMHAKGIAAYRRGDLNLALADFSRAIALNPTFMLAYVNRGIVLYRMGKLDRALADVGRARHIDRTGRIRSAATLHRKRRRDAAVSESPAVPQAAGL